MATTKEDIRSWMEQAKTEGATHLLVVCDTYDWEDYPVFVESGKDAKKVAEEDYGYPGDKNMQRVMECYSLTDDIEAQLNEHRAWHWE